MAYVGVCLVGIKGQRPTDVQVRDDWSGNEQPLALPEYIKRGIKPDWKSLNWCSDNAPYDGPDEAN